MLFPSGCVSPSHPTERHTPASVCWPRYSGKPYVAWNVCTTMSGKSAFAASGAPGGVGIGKFEATTLPAASNIKSCSSEAADANGVPNVFFEYASNASSPSAYVLRIDTGAGRRFPTCARHFLDTCVPAGG